MESGHVSGTDPDKNHQAPKSSENKSSLPTPGNKQHDGSSPLPTSDRISSHAFARTSTTTPTGWSVASNESLFSIHSGNTSFSKERLSLMCTPAELAGYNCDSINISSPLLELPITRQFTVLATKSGNSDEGVGEFGVTESAVAEATRKVFMEQECPVDFSPHSRSISTHSDASFKSFAFPILTGEEDKCGSLKKDTKNKKEQSQPSTSLEENTDISQENPKPEDSWEAPKEETLKTKSTKKAGFKKWFNCFSCCPSRS